MGVSAVMFKIDGEHVANSLDGIREGVHRAEGELVLDFSAVSRFDAAAVTALEKLATAAEGRGAKLVLRGVNVDVYKVLKLVKLAPRFTFLN